MQQSRVDGYDGKTGREDRRSLFFCLQGVAQVAKTADLNATTLYRTLSPKGNPAMKSLTALLRALGMQLAVRPLAQKRAA